MAMTAEIDVLAIFRAVGIPEPDAGAAYSGRFRVPPAKLVALRGAMPPGIKVQRLGYDIVAVWGPCGQIGIHGVMRPYRQSVADIERQDRIYAPDNPCDWRVES